MKAVIFDIDGTLADDSHRLELLEPDENGRKDYEAYNSLMSLDLPKLAVKLLAIGFDKQGVMIYVITGRFARHRAETKAWLLKHGIPFDFLIMRRDGDYRCGTIIKREELNIIRRKGYNVIAAFEDRNKLIDMFREEGLICFAVENRTS